MNTNTDINTRTSTDTNTSTDKSTSTDTGVNTDTNVNTDTDESTPTPTVYPRVGGVELNKIITTDCFQGFANLPDGCVDVVFTSPPYNRKRNDKYAHYDDQVDWFTLLENIVTESFRVLTDDGYLFLNIQKNYYNKRDYFEFIGRFAGSIVEHIVWGKTNPTPASGNNITNSYESFFVLQKYGKPLKGTTTYRKNLFMTNAYSQNQYKAVHKAVMNPEAGTVIFKDFIGDNKVILDPFMGVGTTAILALENNCNYIGFELSEEYTRLARERVENWHKEQDSQPPLPLFEP